MKPSLLTRADAAERAAQVSDPVYEVLLDVTDTAADRFFSTTTVRFDLADPAAGTFLDLEGGTVQSLVVNGAEVAVDHRDGRIHLTGLESSNTVVVRVACPYSRSGVGLHRFTDPVDQQVFLYTQFEPYDARRVYACFDQPDLKGRFSFSVDAPAGWQVVSNAAAAVRPAAARQGRWTFEQTELIPTYITAVVAGPYHRIDDRHGDVDLGLYCRQSMARFLDPDEILTITKAGLDYFSQSFDYPYPFAKYDQLFVPEFNFGAMENPGCVTFSEKYVFRSRVTQASRMSRANTIMHEMAHMWFGDLVTMRWWDDLWLNESFATFMAHTAVADATRFGEDSWSDFAHSMKAWAYLQDQLPSTHPIVADTVDTHSVMANFDGITYAKGASVLKQLHAWVGGDAFLTGVRDYFRTHAYGNAELSDFLRALERPSGRDLAEWAQKWLRTAGVATLAPDITVTEAGLIDRLAITQRASVQHPTLRPHRVAIGLYDTFDGQLTRIDRIEVDVDGPTTTIQALEGKVLPELLLVNDDDLAYAKVRLDETSIQTLERALGTMADGVGRAVCWGSLWDATRDGELAARRFADLVCEHGPTESDISVLETLISQAFACADRFGHPDNRQHLRQRIAKVAHAGLDRAAPGSDRQLVWLRAIIISRADGDFVKVLLDGGEALEELPLDPDLRWSMVRHLAASGLIGEEEIEAERAADPTDLGQRGAETALAARPSELAKERAWAQALDGELAMHTRRAALSGFWQVDQEALLEDYATRRWVEALPSLWESAASEEGLTMTNAIYPSRLVSEQVVAAADRALELDVPDLAKRAVSEGRDATLRALRARLVDT